MAISIVMPAVELSQENGKLVSWQKIESERVAKRVPHFFVTREVDERLTPAQFPFNERLIHGHPQSVVETLTARLVLRGLPKQGELICVQSGSIIAPLRTDCAAD